MYAGADDDHKEVQLVEDLAQKQSGIRAAHAQVHRAEQHHQDAAQDSFKDVEILARDSKAALDDDDQLTNLTKHDHMRATAWQKQVSDFESLRRNVENAVGHDEMQAMEDHIQSKQDVTRSLDQQKREPSPDARTSQKAHATEMAHQHRAYHKRKMEAEALEDPVPRFGTVADIDHEKLFDYLPELVSFQADLMSYFTSHNDDTCMTFDSGEESAYFGYSDLYGCGFVPAENNRARFHVKDKNKPPCSCGQFPIFAQCAQPDVNRVFEMFEQKDLPQSLEIGRVYLAGRCYNPVLRPIMLLTIPVILSTAIFFIVRSGLVRDVFSLKENASEDTQAGKASWKENDESTLAWRQERRKHFGTTRTKTRTRDQKKMLCEITNEDKLLSE